VVVNNLPAAALLAARVPPHPYALLVGLDIGPNLFVTVPWPGYSGYAPPLGRIGATVARSVALGVISVPLAIARPWPCWRSTGSL